MKTIKFKTIKNSSLRNERDESDDLFKSCLVPREADQTGDVEQDDRAGHDVGEDRLHPRLNLQALAGVGLGDEVIPAPAVTLVAAEDGEGEGAQRQQVGGDEEVPEIQPCGALGEGLERQQAVAQRRGGGGDEQADTADELLNILLP